MSDEQQERLAMFILSDCIMVIDKYTGEEYAVYRKVTEENERYAAGWLK